MAGQRFQFNLGSNDINEFKKKQLVQNRVIIRIWTSENNIRNQGVSVGHASVEIDNVYMSLWPSERRKKEFDSVPPDYVLNYQKEVREYEGRTPEYTYCLYKLNKKNVLDKFNELRKTIKGWCLYGGICKDSDSCVSFVWQLLEAGGIKELVSSAANELGAIHESSRGVAFTSKASVASNTTQSSYGSKYTLEQLLSPIIISPDALVNRLDLARQSERKKFPIINSIHEDIEATENFDLKVTPKGISTYFKK